MAKKLGRHNISTDKAYLKEKHFQFREKGVDPDDPTHETHFMSKKELAEFQWLQGNQIGKIARISHG